MADHNIQIAVDSRKAQAGTKAFAGSLNDAFKALRKFDQQSKSTFAALDKLGKVNLGSLQKSARGTAQALETLNRVKVSKALVSNLASLQATLRNFRFSAKSIREVPDVLNALNRVKIDSRIPTVINQLKASLVGFRGPPPGAVKNLQTLINGLAVVNPARIESAANALAKLNGFRFSAPRGGIGGLGNLSRQLGPLRGLQSQIGNLTSTLGHLRTALAGVSTTIALRGIYQTGNAFQTLTRTLAAVATSSDEVGDQMKFLIGLTERMPLSLEAAASSYGKFAIAARLSGITAKESQDTFEGFATAFSAMGVGAEAQRRGFEALIQMFSKGKIQAEEIRQQLAEALPGAMTLLAESMGVTTSQLSKMLEEGKVMATELPGLAKLLSDRFGPSVEIAMKRASAQLTNLSNSFTTLKAIIYNSGFEAGLGSAARTISEALNTDAAKHFAARLGGFLGTAAKHVGAFARVLIENRPAFDRFADSLMLLAGLTAVSGTLRLIGFAVMPVVAAFSLLAKGLGLAKTALVALATGKALSAIGDIGKAFSVLTSKVFLAVSAITLFAAGMDALFNDSRATKALVDGVGRVFSAFAGAVKDFGVEMTSGMVKAYDDALKLSDKYYTEIGLASVMNEDAMRKNAEREAANAAAKLATLTEAEQAVWDEVNAVGKANDEYTKQLAILDAIGLKKGIDMSGFKKVLAAQTLDDRNPVGAMVRDLGEELANLRAKTGEQRALNDAQRDYNDLLARGVDVGAAGLEQLRRYHEGIARMNGEIGNGFERWAASVGDWNDQMQEAIKDGIGGLADEITNFVTGADADFAGLARSILRTFVKISLDSLLKDLFGAMGMDGEKNGAAQAGSALSKLDATGKMITANLVEIYTAGLNVNGVPLADVLADPSRITRAPLADIPGTKVLPNAPSVNDRLPLEGTVSGLRGSLGVNGADLNSLGLRGTLDAGASPVATALNTASSNATAQLRYINTSATRNMKLTESLESKIQEAVGAVYGEGSRADIYSGGQTHDRNPLLKNMPGGWTGSTRHNGGMAADAYIYGPDGKRLTGDGLAPLAQYWQAKKFGGTGLEMRGGGIHLDEHADRAPFWSYGTMTKGQRAAINAGQHGMFPEMSGAGGASQPFGQIDPMTTQGIDALNAKLQTVGTTAAQTAPAFDTMKAANQNLATASTTAGINVQTAGTMASGAAPQFTTAGTSIEAAGQKAAMGAQQAQSATPGLDGFGNGVSQLLGPLASAIPGLGQFGSAIMQLLSSLFMGGGIGGGLFAEGGYSTSPVARASLPAGVWANAPHYAEGIANTSGGMPAILHPNEAVIPLTRGREVPVDLGREDRRDDRNDNRRGPISVNQTFVVKDADSFRRSKREVQVQTMSAMQRAQTRA